MRSKRSNVIHDNSMHTGSAKRDTASGVAGLDSSGNILGTGPELQLNRDANGDHFITSRQAGEFAMTLRRTGANAYTIYNNTVAGAKVIQDSSMKNIASGILGYDAQLLMGGAGITAFNLLKIYSTGIFTETLTGSVVTSSPANGTLQLTNSVNGANGTTLETDQIALSLLPRIATFKVNALSLAGATSQAFFGLFDSAFTSGISIITADGGSTWNFQALKSGAGSTNAAVTVAAGDVFTIYATSARASCFKNGALVATHVTNIPVTALGHILRLIAQAGGGAGNTLTLGFMS